MSLETFKRVIPLVAVLTGACEVKPQEDIAKLTCAELNDRIHTVTENHRRYPAPTIEGQAIRRKKKEEQIERLELVKRAKNCE